MIYKRGLGTYVKLWDEPQSGLSLYEYIYKVYAFIWFIEFFLRQSVSVTGLITAIAVKSLFPNGDGLQALYMLYFLIIPLNILFVNS